MSSDLSGIIVGRTRARSQAIQLLFQSYARNVDVESVIASGEYALENGPADKYALRLARGAAENRVAIDRLLSGVSENWNLSRMPLVDRCIMSVALYEMFCEPDVPVSVAINESVDLSKVYGSDDTSSFVNGLLGRIARLSDENPELDLQMLSRLVKPEEEEPAEPEAEDAAESETAADGESEEGADDESEAETAEDAEPEAEDAGACGSQAGEASPETETEHVCE